MFKSLEKMIHYIEEDDNTFYCILIKYVIFGEILVVFVLMK